MFGTRGKAVVLVAAAVAGYAGAAAFSALALPSVEIASDYGPGDGLTRYVVTASADAVTGLDGLPGVVNSQRLSDGRTLVATDGLTPAELQRVPGVSAVEVSPSVPVMASVTDPYWPNYGWNLDNTGTNAYSQTAVADADTDAPDAWPTSTGSPVVVAVVDTGYYTAHPDLQGALWTNPDCATDADGGGRVGDCHGWNFTTDSPDVDNGSYGTHGTSVAGVIAARAGNGEGSAGVAPGVQIMPLVVGSGESVDVYLGAEAIRYAADHGASVINASWGGAFSGPALDTLKSAVAYAAAKGVLVVAAAGNDSANRDTSIVYPASLTDPNLITVGAATAGDTVSDFSAYGASSVDLFAPGTLVFTTWNDGGYRLVSGTSIAAPQVAAALALYRAVDPSATTAQLRDRLLADVDPVPAFVGKSVTGGRLSLTHLGDSNDAVRYAFTSMTSPAGTVSPHVAATDPDAGVGAYSVELGIGMEYGREVMALSGAVVTLGGTSATTDDDGLVHFDLGSLSGLDGVDIAPSVDLEDGRYVLTAQVYRDGSPLGRAHAAPLLVGSSVVTPGGTTGGSGSGGSAPGGSTGDSTGSSGDSASGGSPTGDSTTGGADPGSAGSGSGSGPAGSGGSGGSTGDPGAGPAPGSSGGSTPGDSPSGSGSVPEEPTGSAPDATGGSTPPAGGGSPIGSGTGSSGSGSSGSGPGSAGSGDGGSAAPGAGPVPEEGGTVEFPAVGSFRITSLSPARVSTDGGTLVIIVGEALPSGARVLVGTSASATVTRSSATEVVFRAPARVAGTYTVTVFAPDGRSTALDSALEYVDATASGGAGSGGSGSAGSGGSGGAGGSDGTAPGGSGTGGSDAGGAGGSGGSGSAGSGGSGGSGGTTDPVVRRGPHGERLVQSAHFAGLSSIWSLDCSAACAGVAI
ncbi:S8 family serine peptidase [Petropleomorpha daqingensis]|uniref:Subtilisin family serine protease n=1 Tax=Petropleomorpha daqingensis TaxID=2026353 RepID=A0A853CCL0_9ACTN|nr:S8 family serine peptidase [Petropleomorpha daqingensis]NYJ05107.1 subtilisin family serine protease [Petropleomorpha daqingensis]